MNAMLDTASIDAALCLLVFTSDPVRSMILHALLQRFAGHASELAPFARSQNRTVRTGVYRLAANLEGDAAFAVLASGVDDSDPDLRLEIAQMLCSRGERSFELIERIWSSTASRYPPGSMERRLLLLAAVSSSPRGIPLALEHLADFCGQDLDLLRAVAAYGARAYPLLYAALASPSRAQRYFAMQILSHVEDGEVIGELRLLALEQHNLRQAVSAVEALGMAEHYQHNALMVLLEILDQTHRRVLATPRESLWHRLLPKPIRRWLRRPRVENRKVHREALAALAWFDQPPRDGWRTKRLPESSGRAIQLAFTQFVTPVLVRVAEDLAGQGKLEREDWDRLLAAITTLLVVTTNDRPAQFVGRWIEGSNPVLQELALFTVAEALPAIAFRIARLTATLLPERTAEICELIASARESQEALCDLLTPVTRLLLRCERTEPVTIAALTALRSFPKLSQELREGIVRLARQDSPAVQCEALRTMRKFLEPDPQNLPVVEFTLASPQAKVRKAALEFLACAGPKAQPALARVMRLLRDPDEETRRLAEYILATADPQGLVVAKCLSG